jgi:hypothetical protein
MVVHDQGELRPGQGGSRGRQIRLGLLRTLAGTFGQQLRQLATALRPDRLFPGFLQQRFGGGDVPPEQLNFAGQFRGVPHGRMLAPEFLYGGGWLAVAHKIKFRKV